MVRGMEALLTTLHVVGAVFIVGPMAILPMTAMRAIRAGQGAQVAVLATSTFVFSLLSLLVAVLGFGVLGVSSEDDMHATISTPWVLVSIILYAVALALTLIAVVPSLRSAAEHLQDPAAQDLKSVDYRRIAIGSGVATLMLVIVVVLMAWKPGA
jgi:uncharacterized membrane protein